MALLRFFGCLPAFPVLCYFFSNIIMSKKAICGNAFSHEFNPCTSSLVHIDLQTSQFSYSRQHFKLSSIESLSSYQKIVLNTGRGVIKYNICSMILIYANTCLNRADILSIFEDLHHIYLSKVYDIQ